MRGGRYGVVLGSGSTMGLGPPWAVVLTLPSQPQPLADSGEVRQTSESLSLSQHPSSTVCAGMAGCGWCLLQHLQLAGFGLGSAIGCAETTWVHRAAATPECQCYSA